MDESTPVPSPSGHFGIEHTRRLREKKAEWVREQKGCNTQLPFAAQVERQGRAAAVQREAGTFGGWEADSTPAAGSATNAVQDQGRSAGGLGQASIRTTAVLYCTYVGARVMLLDLARL